MVPGGVYRVGESAPETLYMGARGGYVVPDGGAGAAQAGGSGGITVVVNVSSASDPYDIADEVGWELRKLRRFG